MLTASGAELDQSLFAKGNESQFSMAVSFTVHVLEQAGEIVRDYEGYDRIAAGKGIAREIEDEGGEMADMLGDLADTLGEDFMAGFMADISEEGKPEVSEEEYEEAKEKRAGAETQLIDYTVGYHDFLKDGLVAAYGEDGEDIDREAWTATWRKLKSILGGSEGTLLAEAAGFFDGLVRARYGDKYKPMEEDRGPAVREDVCASTFYTVMKDHLHRAIIGANRDDWTGYQ